MLGYHGYYTYYIHWASKFATSDHKAQRRSRLQKLLSTIHIALVSPSLRRTSAPIQFTIVLGVLGTQETLCYLVA